MNREEELLRKVHKRAEELREKREKRMTAALFTGGGILTAAAAAVVLSVSVPQHPLTESGFAGASLLSDSAGGYVLAAVLAFMAGVVVTLACVRYRQKKEEDGEKNTGKSE